MLDNLITKDKIKKLLLPILFIAAFGWTLYYILSYDNYYTGEPLTNLKVALKDKPEFYFDGNTKNSFYHFTTNEYKNVFRIEEGGKDLIRENKTFIRQLESLKRGDTININIRTSETEKLLNDGKLIGVIGLAIKDTLLIDPLVVKKIDRKNKIDRLFFNYLFLLILIIFHVRTYLKSKTKK